MRAPEQTPLPVLTTGRDAITVTITSIGGRRIESGARLWQVRASLVLAGCTYLVEYSYAGGYNGGVDIEVTLDEVDQYPGNEWDAQLEGVTYLAAVADLGWLADVVHELSVGAILTAKRRDRDVARRAAVGATVTLPAWQEPYVEAHRAAVSAATTTAAGWGE
jgi:hypothetical protein